MLIKKKHIKAIIIVVFLVLAAGMIIPAFNMKTMSSRHYGTTGLMQQIRQGIINYEEDFGVKPISIIDLNDGLINRTINDYIANGAIESIEYNRMSKDNDWMLKVTKKTQAGVIMVYCDNLGNITKNKQDNLPNNRMHPRP